MADAEIALQVPGMDEAVVTRDVVYRRRLRLDVYRPPSGARVPAVLLVHGRTNDPSPKDWRIYVGWGQLLAAHGLAGIPFNHRGDAGDIPAALAAVRDRASELGIDRDRLALASFSAGVPWGMDVALADGGLRSALAFYGPPDADLARPDAPPTFLAKAGLDEPFINEAIDAYARRAKALGADVRVVTHARGLHGFDARNHDARSRAILRQAIAFAREHLDSSPACEGAPPYLNDYDGPDA
jgi:dienelactone hydrolase